MKHLKTYHYLIYPLLYLLFFGIITFFDVENSILQFGLPAFLSILCAPKYTTVATQTGEKTIVKWMFLKKSFEE